MNGFQFSKSQVWSLKFHVYYLFCQTMQLDLYSCIVQTNKQKRVTKDSVLTVSQIIMAIENNIIA